MNLSIEEKKHLIREAQKAREASYSPYSHFAVGAALLTEDGKIYRGCNIENAAYSPTVCAERTAIFKAVSEGDHSFAAIAIVGGNVKEKELDFCAPCGVCRQVMMEFCHPEDFEIILSRTGPGREPEIKTFLLSDLSPQAFGPAYLIE